MAGGKQSPRQKMINLMYLVFIAMLALNMSKEVLTAFGLIEESVAENNTALDSRNELSFAALAEKAAEQPKQYGEAAKTADDIIKVSDKFTATIEALKEKMLGSVDAESRTDYEVQDKADFLNDEFFVGDKLKPEGEAFKNAISNYQSDMLDAIPNKEQYADIRATLQSKFDTQDVRSERGNEKSPKIDYLKYHFEGYPLIASKTKLTAMQNDVKNVEAEVLSQLLKGELIQVASMNNYDAFVKLDKSAYFAGESVKGEVVLGRKDGNLKPFKVTVNGGDATDKVENGAVQLAFGAGGIGDKKIRGEIIFKEGDSLIPIPFEQEYKVIGKPNSATIKADKMNVVYRGLDNPMTIAFAGVPASKVRASGNGLSDKGGGKYVMRPTSGREVTISVTGTLNDGTTVSDKDVFRIKDLPRPIGTISKEFLDVKKNRSNLAVSTVGATFGDDFDFELTPRVTEFLFKVPGAPSVKVSGTRLNGAAKGNLRKARKGDIVQFAQIKATVPGVKLKGVTPVAVELLD